ncbi:5-fold beta-flower protein [Pedobacter panaciterrae]
MRTKPLLFFALVSMFTTALTIDAVAQKTTGTDQNQKNYINKKGEIHDHGWNKLGFITPDNVVKNAMGKTLYFIDGSGNVIDSKGKRLGKAQKNGNYYNIKGENIITVKDLDEKKCEILDPKGHSLGTTHKNYKLHACAAHCYFLEQQLQKSGTNNHQH